MGVYPRRGVAQWLYNPKILANPVLTLNSNSMTKFVRLSVNRIFGCTAPLRPRREGGYCSGKLTLNGAALIISVDTPFQMGRLNVRATLELVADGKAVKPSIAANSSRTVVLVQTQRMQRMRLLTNPAELVVATRNHHHHVDLHATPFDEQYCATRVE
jgi:hypothetical protein